MSRVEEGHVVSDFDLPTDGGGRVRLTDFKGKKVVLYFYPAAQYSTLFHTGIDFNTLD